MLYLDLWRKKIELPPFFILAADDNVGSDFLEVHYCGLKYTEAIETGGREPDPGKEYACVGILRLGSSAQPGDERSDKRVEKFIEESISAFKQANPHIFSSA